MFFLHVNKFTQKILMKKKLGNMLSGGVEGKNNEVTMTTMFMVYGFLGRRWRVVV